MTALDEAGATEHSIIVAGRALRVEVLAGLEDKEREALLAELTGHLESAVAKHGPCAIEPRNACNDGDSIPVSHGVGTVARVLL